MKIKPTKNWAIFWDIEHGQADNVFTRLENYRFTNYRVRSRWTIKSLGINIAAISKDNNNPSETNETPPRPFGTDFRASTLSGDVDWNPSDRVRVSGGYTYRKQTSITPILIYVPDLRLGSSEFYMRDHNFYVDVSAKIAKRFSIYGAYRYNNDDGQGNRVATVPQNIITGYPMKFITPEVKAAIRLSKNVDWNIGYQYYKYDDVQAPSQNYRAHLPYTSLRIYFGGGVVDR